MTRIAYFRVSTTDQSIEAQRSALGGGFDKEFTDEGVSGAVRAADRSGFAALLGYVREGDVVCVWAVDRLGRDAIDVQMTVRAMLDKGVSIDVHGLGVIGRGVGELIVAVLAQVAEMDRARIRANCENGRATARKSLAETGRTQHGRAGLGRPFAAVASDVVAWRAANGASVANTAAHFGISPSSVKRYCAA